MRRQFNDYTIKESLFFSQRMMQLSKALWKAIEKDWEQWIKPYNLNINEHHILWITYYLKDVAISDIAKLGVMHVSTAFNFSRKLEDRGYLQFSKKGNDMRNTYLQLTEKGEELVLTIFKNYNPLQNPVVKGALPLKHLYGKFPEFIEMMAIVRNIYGDEYMEIIQYSIDSIDKNSLQEYGGSKNGK